MLRREGEVFLFGTAMAEDSFKRDQPKGFRFDARNSSDPPQTESSGVARSHARTV